LLLPILINITSWQTYVVGMDKKRRMTKSSFVTKAFKPLLAQLATPHFLIEGDSAILIGKGINYTTSAAAVKTNFTINGNRIKQDDKEIAANNSFIDELNIKQLSQIRSLLNTRSIQQLVLGMVNKKDPSFQKRY
jgi:hypothetical protein